MKRFRIPAVLMASALLGAIDAAGAQRLVRIRDLAGFVRDDASAGVATWTSIEISPGPVFRELVVSWNPRPTVSCRVEVQVRTGSDWGRWWRVADWSPEPGPGRSSLGGQKADGQHLDTDTLVLDREATAARVRVSAPPSDLPLLALSFWSPDPAGPVGEEPVRSFQVPALEVPRRSQADFPDGVTRWCSPTSTSMLLGHWAGVLGRPEIDAPVPVVAAGVDDPAWGGTGNWVFNTAFAGSRPGLQACVARLGGVDDLAALNSAGIPVAVSVSYALLKGADRIAPGDGHLVVVCGFAGDKVVINDPGVRMSRVRREFPLADFRRAWDASHRTAYLVWPSDRALPPSPTGTW